jgi:hypothetical protein
MNAHFYPRYRLLHPRFRFPYRNSDRRSLQRFSHIERMANLDGDNQLLFSERRPAFNGLFVAALMATCFWVPLAFAIINKLK